MRKEDIFAINDIKMENVDVPEWNTKLWVKTMDGREFSKLQMESVDQKGKPRREGFMINLLVKTICDEKGNLMFGQSDADALGKKGAPALRTLFDAACRVNGIGKEEVDEITKN